MPEILILPNLKIPAWYYHGEHAWTFLVVTIRNVRRIMQRNRSYASETNYALNIYCKNLNIFMQRNSQKRNRQSFGKWTFINVQNEKSEIKFSGIFTCD
jgi:hypothetical protein